MSTKECRFYPVQCSDETFQTLTPQEGYMYFVTDTKKIYLGKNGKMVPMGSGSTFFYGVKEIEYDNSGIAPDPNVIFYHDDLEESERIPAEDDLILNTDGCFYRIRSVADDGYETVRLTLQGTGVGGGGGGTGGGGSTGGSWSFTVIDGKAKTYASTATKMEITFKANYSGTDDNQLSGIAFKRKGDEDPFYSVDKVMAFNTEQTVDIFAYKHLFNTNKTTVTMYLYDIFGVERSTNITVQIVDLELQKTVKCGDLIYSKENTFNYSCILVGATSGVEDKAITYKLYTQDNQFTPVTTWEKKLATTDEDEIQHGLDLSALNHEVYVLKVQASARIAGTTTTLTSNVLTHKLARYVAGSNQPLLMIAVPEVTEQYTNIPVQYMLFAEEANKAYTLDLKLNGVSKIQLAIQSNVAGTYNLYFEEQGTYTLLANIMELNLAFSTYLTISTYSGNLPVIDPTRSDLMLYLNPRNKSNSATDRDVWSDYSGNHVATLTDLHYGTANGWLMDEVGVSHLKLSSGAKLALDSFRPFEKDPTKADPNDSRMGSGMTIELDFEVNGVLDYDTELISCLSRNKDKDIQVGFVVTGDRVRFYSSSGALLSLNLVEGKRTRVSFVIEPNTGIVNFPMVYGYLNGKISGAVIYNAASDSFNDTQEGQAKLKIDSEDAQIKIYGIRFYSTALSDRLILNNYTASLGTLEERQTAYDSNNVYDAKGKIDLLKVSAEEYNLQVPYMVLTGGYATEKESKWQRKDSSDPIGRLPTGKKDYRMVDVKVHYPDTPYFANYEDYEFINKFASGKTMALAYGEKPSNGGAIMYAQGTSSMEYPVKNLRLRFKNDENWYRVRPDIAKVEIICMKADYMESSGSHNTGAANLVDALYKGIGIETPGQAHFGGEGKDTIVTCIKGHPCLIFYSPTGEEGTYEYIGKYNLNLDKATPEPFGFDHDDEEFGYLKPGDEYYEIDYDDDDKYIDTKEGEERKVVAEGELVNSIHCFEFLDNAVEVCNFLGKQQLEHVPELTAEQFDNNKSGNYYIGTELADGSMKYELAGEEFDTNAKYYYNTPMDYHKTWYDTFTNKENEQVPGWTLGFESRYPEDKVGYHDADALYPLASWLNSLQVLRKRDAEGEKEAIARFKNEYQCYLDKEFTLTYYLLTEALLMTDSRVKNMMIATWGRENYDLTDERRAYYPLIKDADGKWVPNTSAEKVMTNNYIFYPIFYDMDTMMGLDNTGVYRFNYFDEDTNRSVFNGDDVLWNFVRDALIDDLRPWYTEMEGALLYVSKDSTTGQDAGILPYFNNNQANLANEAFYNGDAKYKYTDPARNGYHDDLYDKDIAPGVGPYLYAAQGDRSLMREWFMSNRIKFLRGKYNSSHFKNGDRIEYRWYFPTGNETEFTDANGVSHKASIAAVAPSDTFTLNSIKTGYAGIMVGANASSAHIQRFDGEDEKTIVVPEARNANGTEAYLLGLSNLSDLGDLSNKYMQKFIVSSSDVRLEHLTLGNPHKDYYNPYWSTTVDSKSPEIDVSKAIYLKTFNLQNCITYKGNLNFKECTAVEQILLTGSGVNGLTLPSGGILTELRLPTSIKKLTIDSHEDLTANNFSIGGYNYGSDNLIGGNGGSYTNDYSLLTEIKIINTPIDTYSMVRGARNLESYCLRGVTWTAAENDVQYCLRTKESIKDPSVIPTYYVYDANDKEYKLWGQAAYPTDDRMLYERMEMVQNGEVVCIPVLEYLMTKSYADSFTPAEALTGKLTLSIPGVKVNELAIYKKYVDVYPDLEIAYENMDVEGAQRVNFYYADIGSIKEEEGIEKLIPYFTKMTANDEASLNDLITGSGFNPPNKSPTSDKVYVFTGEWTDWNTKTVYYQDGYFDENTAPDPTKLFSNVYPTANMDLLPHFDETTRIYVVGFYDYTYPAEGSLLFEIEGEYQNVIGDILKNTPNEYKSKYQYRPADAECGPDERYTLMGWQNESSFNNGESNPALYDLSTLQITSDLKLFAHYKIEDATMVATNLEFFNTIKNYDAQVGSAYQRGNIIALNPNYANLLGGKITLPSVDKDGEALTIVQSMYHNSLITDIYFLSSAQYTAVADGSCENMDSLVSVRLPATVTKIGNNAFMNSENLMDISLSDNVTMIGSQAFYVFSGSSNNGSLKLNKLPTSLVTLGDRAFCNAGPNVVISDLPLGVTRVGTQCFMGCSNVTICYFGGEGSSLTTIGYQAFQSACTGPNNVTEIVINPGVVLQKSASGDKYSTFGGGYRNVTNLIISATAHDYGEEVAQLKLDIFDGIRENMTVSQIN